MKSLNLARPLVLMMVGIPGAGKSFFAKRFSETFGAPVVGSDRIRYELFAKPEFNARENDIIRRLADYQIQELLKSQRTFIVDGGCNAKADRMRLRTVIKEAGYDVLIIWVQVHEPTAQTRALKRNTRRADDQFNHSLSLELFNAFVQKLTPPTRENHVVISGMHTYSTQAKAVLRRIVLEREVEADSAHKAESKTTLQHTSRPRQMRRSIILR